MPSTARTTTAARQVATKGVAAGAKRKRGGVTVMNVNVTVYRSKAHGSDWSIVGDVVCETVAGCLVVKDRRLGYASAVFAPGQWVTVNVAPI